jgi:hypothetical protein
VFPERIIFVCRGITVVTLRSSRQSQSQSQDVFVIQPELVVRHYYKAQKRSNANCNISSSEASLRTNQSFVCVKTDYCAIVPMSACSQLDPGLWPDSSSFENLYRMSATSAKRVTQRNQCCLLHSSKTTKADLKSAFCVYSIFGFNRNVERRRVLKLYIKYLY